MVHVRIYKGHSYVCRDEENSHFITGISGAFLANHMAISSRVKMIRFMLEKEKSKPICLAARFTSFRDSFSAPIPKLRGFW